MKKLLIFITLILTTVCFTNSYAFAASIHSAEDSRYLSNPNEIPTQSEDPSFVGQNKTYAADRELNKKVFGFHPYWMTNSWKNYDYSLLSTIAYFGADLNANGSIGEKHDWPVNDLTAKAHEQNTKVVLVFKSFSTGNIRTLLSSADNRNRAISNMIAEVKKGNGDGANIDFEYVPQDQRDNFTTFVRDLTNKFHQEIPGSEVSLDAPAVDWNNSWDIYELAKATDVLMVMGYDYHYAGGSTAGPVAPLESGNQWGNINVTKTVQTYKNAAKENTHKVLLGVPYYGYDWPTASGAVPSNTTGAGSAVRYNTLKDNIDSGKRTRQWNNDSHTPYYIYNSYHQTWFDDAESLSKKYNVVNEYGLGGIGIWALGYDAGKSELWNEIATHFTTEKKEPTPVVNGTSKKMTVIAVAAGIGGGPHVRVFDTQGNVQNEPRKLFPYPLQFRGGVNVALGDIDGDGSDEIITAPREGGGPQVRAFEQNGTARGIDIWPFHKSSRTGISVAAGDVDGDGKDEIAVAQQTGGQAWVKVYRYNKSRTVIGEWNAFGSVQCGASVAMGDIDKDGKDEIIVGAGEGGGPLVRVFEADGTPKPIQFFAFSPKYRGGVDVDAGDVDGDGKAEIAVSQKKEQAWTKVYRYNSAHSSYGEWKAYANFPVGTHVALGDITNNGKMEVITAPVVGGPQIRQFDYKGNTLKSIRNGAGFFAFSPKFRGGADVAVGVK